MSDQNSDPMTSGSKHPPRHKPYRIIYQSDSSGGLAAATDVNDYINGMVGFLDNTHVDALFWGDGAGGNTANYQSDVLELSGERIGKINPFLQQLINEGNDPPKIVIREAKKRGVDIFYSFRINDCHDSINDGQWLPGHLATFKTEHPEWMIGPGHPYGGPHQLNFAVPEVLDLKFAVIEEIFAKYDFDGLEIDFMRSAPHFIPGTEPDNAPILTDLLRRVRQHLIQRGNERGRPIPLAVRVTETMEACRLDGFDLAAWVDQRLVDMIILGSGAIDIEVEVVKRVTEGTGILVYPCLYGWPCHPPCNPISPEMVRALAVNFWHQGADGIYTFNWNAHSYMQLPKEHQRFKHLLERLREIDDPQSLRGKDKQFAAGRGRPTIYYPHNNMNCILPVTLDAGQQVDIPVMVGEDFSPPPATKQIELVIELNQPTDDPSISLTLNQTPLTNLRHDDAGLTSNLEPDQLTLGHNIVGISVGEGKVEVTAIEIRVSY